MKKKISDVKVGDKIKGTDGKWHRVIDKTEVKNPYIMYEITFSNGKAKCADTHLWSVYIGDKLYNIDAMGIETEFDFYKGRHVGTKNGPTIVGIKRIKSEPVQCITTDAKDHQFMIYTEE